MRPKTWYLILMLSGILACVEAFPQQTPDSLPARPRYSKHYTALTLLTGPGILSIGKDNGGILNISFPYTLAGNPSQTQVFHSGDKQLYTSSAIIFIPVNIEFGNLHHFVSASLNILAMGSSAAGFNFTLGYGRQFYLNGFGRHAGGPEMKKFVFRPSINLSYINDNGDNQNGQLGSIDNRGKTLGVFGKVSDSTFTVYEDSDPDGAAVTSDTYNTKSLNIEYVDRELSVMPKIALSGNPFRNRVRWEIAAGYNIPVAAWGGIRLYQQSADGTTNNLTKVIPLHHPGIVATYNGKAIIPSSPFFLEGPFVNFDVSYVYHKHR